MLATVYPVFLIFTALALSGCAGVTSRSSTEPSIARVTQWGGTAADETLAQPHTINRITLHHQGVAFPRERDPQQYLRDLQTWSRKSKGWIDVPYHYVIDLDGNVYEGRDIRFRGDTNTDYDPAGHALIEVVGNFEIVEPNAAQLEAVVNMMAMLALKHDVPVEAIRGHRDHAPDTTCPGKNLYRYFENGYFDAQVRARMAVVKIR
jgi:uncharacterized protein YceK